jgi:hypothetical protein
MAYVHLKTMGGDLARERCACGLLLFAIVYS